MTEPPELTPTEKARWQTVKGAIHDFGYAAVRGDSEGADAALRQVQQIDVDHARIRDAVHVPDDAGEWADRLERILRRIPDGWGRWISCDKGWYSLVCELDEAIAEIDPSYTVHQVKEKFGRLCFYANWSNDVDSETVSALIRYAEAQSELVCERCGEPGRLCRSEGAFPWMKTLCQQCIDVLAQPDQRMPRRYRPDLR